PLNETVERFRLKLWPRTFPNPVIGFVSSDRLPWLVVGLNKVPLVPQSMKNCVAFSVCVSETFDRAICQLRAAVPMAPPLVVVNVKTSHSPPPAAATDVTLSDRAPPSTVVVPAVSVSVSEAVFGAFVRLRLKDLPRLRNEACAGCPRANAEIPIAETKRTVIDAVRSQ